MCLVLVLLYGGGPVVSLSGTTPTSACVLYKEVYSNIKHKYKSKYINMGYQCVHLRRSPTSPTGWGGRRGGRTLADAGGSRSARQT